MLAGVNTSAVYRSQAAGVERHGTRDATLSLGTGMRAQYRSR